MGCADAPVIVGRPVVSPADFVSFSATARPSLPVGSVGLKPMSSDLTSATPPFLSSLENASLTLSVILPRSC
jgi:hypothetical protein